MQSFNVELKDGTYELKYPNRSVFKMDERLGYSCLHIVEKAEEQGPMAAFSTRDITIVIWAGMLHSHPRITPEEVADKIDLDMSKYSQVVQIATSAIMKIHNLNSDVIETYAADEDEDSEPESGKKNPGKKSAGRGKNGAGKNESS